ncbi:ATP-binding cassette domain-containing protein [Finegoldia magna]|uniref:ABC transporter ATP-binding protein n=1 Tax=Finegoldia magna TaxID=1260 RepID=A0A233VK93_FINMA|nr:ABC transporter ATP-binding protein [Finegoldia magna]EGS31847.1 ABC transporter, ATP-binding protein [Finegoldia magna SY403409CC001050417]MBS6927383.1 ABC transporter ATP-binding protein [Finegoldia magna]MCC3310693.1 ABC transporter ATP-binding protein [Finegoldia magna]MDU6599329.1 ABC transporter ATP-binding protein [Finegoldia magna]OXZ32826.1 ABC transporter ATP-binding protein [Finegoldia magna]
MLQVIDLEKKYGDKTILDKVNFGLEKGQIKALVGPNGSGKTTLMNSISNSIKIDGGKIVIDNEQYDDEKIFNKLTFFRDETILDFNMKGIDYLELIKNAYKKSTEDVNNICKKYEIEGFAHKRVGEYSLGMKKKLMLAMSFLPGNDYVLLDEPLNGLDPTSVIKTKNLLKEIAKQNVGIIISSHGLNDLDDISRDILFLKDKKILEEKLESVKYLNLSTSNDELVKKTLMNNGYEYENKLIILKDENIKSILKILSQLDVNIYSIDKKSKSSQERYMELFKI